MFSSAKLAKAVKTPAKNVNFTIINRLDIKLGYTGYVRYF